MAQRGGGYGSYADGIGGYAYFLDKKFKYAIKKARKESTYVVIVIHAGAEGFNYPLPEIRAIYKEYIDLGADCVIAHHPHVVQGYEDYKGHRIYYSLGNMAFDKGKGGINPNSLSIALSFEKDNIQYKHIFTSYQNNMLQTNVDAKFESFFKEISDNLHTQRYGEIIDEFCLKMLHETYTTCYEKACFVYHDSLLGKLKQFVRRCILKRRINPILLYHNLNIETHYWIVRRALQLEYKTLTERKIDE